VGSLNGEGVILEYGDVSTAIWSMLPHGGLGWGWCNIRALPDSNFGVGMSANGVSVYMGGSLVILETSAGPQFGGFSLILKVRY
jgi:hypothetical protein